MKTVGERRYTNKTAMLFKSSTGYTNRELFEVLPDGAWKGRPCFIVGGGPSLRGFDWTLLKGHRTIGVNRAFEVFDPTIIFSMDTRFLNWLMTNKYRALRDGGDALEKFNASPAYKVWLATYCVSLPDEFFILKAHQNYKASLRAFTFSMKDGLGSGNQSGYGALNLAVCLQANPIYLLGFDGKHADTGETHWHAGHPVKQKKELVDKFGYWFKYAARRLTGTEFNVINLNPDSAIHNFKKRPYREVLN